MPFKDVYFSLLITEKTSDVAVVCAAACKTLRVKQQLVSSVDVLNEISAEQPIDLILLDADYLTSDELNDLIQSLRQTVTPVLLLMDGKDIEKIDLAYFDGIRDFCCKPLVLPILQAKISGMLKIRQALLQQQENLCWLDQFRANVEQERAVACNLFNTILCNDFLENSAVKSVLSENSLCIGDMVLVSRTPNDYLHVLVGDFSGKGISASITAGPVAEVFYGMTAKGFDIEEIAIEINRKLEKILTLELFLATALVCLQPDKRALEVINCGFPDLILVNRETHQCKSISSTNLPLGIERSPSLHPQTMEVTARHYLYLLTDAVIELENEDGEPFGAEMLKTAICEGTASVFDRLQESLQQHCADETALKNLTYVELCCDIESVPWKSNDDKMAKQKVEALPWKTMMEFDIKTLREINPVPIMLNVLMEVQDLQDHQQKIFLIVTELFANALDHGVLKLDSSIKASPEGFMRFYDLREKLLHALDTGFVRVFFEHQPTATGGRLIIKVRDSGNGFSFADVEAGLNDNQSFSGRGIGLLKSLCSQLTYHGPGNRVTAIYDWNR